MAEPFICTELSPWLPGLTEKGTPIVHPEAEAVGGARGWLSWGNFGQRVRCPVCGAEWVKK